MTEDPKITNNMILAAKGVFVSTAWEQAIKPIVEGYQKEILQRHKFIGERDKTPILESKHTYLMADKDFQIYLKESEECRKAAGLKMVLSYDEHHDKIIETDRIMRQRPI